MLICVSSKQRSRRASSPEWSAPKSCWRADGTFAGPMRRALLILVAVVAFAAIVAALAPASLASVALERLTGDAVALAEAAGTFERGRGAVTPGRRARMSGAWVTR